MTSSLWWIFHKYALVGVVLEWIRRDMKTEPAVMVERMGRMLQGDLRRALCRLASNKIPSGTGRLNRKNRQNFINLRRDGFSITALFLFMATCGIEW